MNKIKILLADDHAILRAGLRALLSAEPDCEVVGEAGDGAEALAVAQERLPDVILLDLSMPGLGGLEALRELKQRLPRAKVLVLTMHDDEGYLYQVLQAGASGYLLKRAADSELLAAIRAVHRGDTYLYPSLAKALVEDYLKLSAGGHLKGIADKEAFDGLSPREREVLRLIAQGHTNQEIAGLLVVSVKTVETHKARITQKLGLRSRADLVRYALRKGLLSG